MVRFALLILFFSLAAVPKSASAQECWSAPIRGSNHQFSRGVCSWQTLKNENIVMQQYDYSCGAAALSTILQYYWGDYLPEREIIQTIGELLTDEEWRDRFENGLAISDIRRAAVEQGYLSSIGTLDWQQLRDSRLPLIIPIRTRGYDHFVVYRGHDLDRVYLADPIRGNIRVPIDRFLSQWQQNAILVVVKPGEELKDYAPLLINGNDLFYGEVNMQRVRSRQRLNPSVHRFTP